MEYNINLSGFNIKQKKGFQSTTLDSILVADYVKINKNSKNILEIGSGFGYISMYIARKSKAKVIGIEKEKVPYLISNENMLNNNIENLEFINEDILDYKKIFREQSFDIIVSNPPYFKRENIDKLKDSFSLNQARVEGDLTLDKIIEISNYLLKNRASLYLIFRSERLSEIISYLLKYNLKIKNLKPVFTKKGDTQALISMIKITKSVSEGLIIEDPIYIYNEKGDKNEYIKKFYTQSCSNNNGWEW